MKTVNLIPAPRRDAKRRRRHRNACAAVCCAYALVLGCAVGIAHLAWPGGEPVESRLTAVDKDIDRLDHEGALVRAELAVASASIEANHTVAEQPDWSILLTLLAKTTGDDVVLRSISVAPPLASAAAVAPAPGSRSPAPPAAPEVILEVAGIGRTPLSVSRHVLKLEETGLFAKVVLLDHNREAYLNDNAIAFRVQCTFGDPAPQRQSPAAGSLPRQPAVSAVENGGAIR
jgi:hypothetical protein